MKKLLFLTIAMQIALFAETVTPYIQINSGDVVEDHVNYLEKKYYELELDKTQTVNIQLTDLDADLDLYVAINRRAAIRNNVCFSSNGGTTNEECVLTSIAPEGKENSIIILVYGFKESNYKLRITTKEGAEEITELADTPLSGHLKQGESKQYKFSAKKGETYTTTLFALSDDADVRVKVGRKAGIHSFDCKSTNGRTKIDECSVTLTKDDTVYVHVNGYRTADYQIAVSKSTTNASLTLAKLKEMIANNEDVTQVDTSAITDMSNLFNNNREFNQDISGWDVSNVTDMSHMFSNAQSFNQPIGSWNVSNVTNMENMFYSAIAFNQPINNWDVSHVTNMKGLFMRGMTSDSTFNQPLNNWNVSNVTNMNSMFNHADNFNQPLENWDVSNVTNMGDMFSSTKYFNQTLSNWNVSNVSDMSFMFAYTNNFNQSLENWDVSHVTDMSGMFYSASSFNQPIGNWNVSNVANMSMMFSENYVFNQPIGSWNVSNVRNMSGMFSNKGTNPFNQPISSWDVSKVEDMNSMFFNCNFNQDISKWDVSNVTNMWRMLDGYQTKFKNHDLSQWNVSKVIEHDSFTRYDSNVIEPKWNK